MCDIISKEEQIEETIDELEYLEDPMEAVIYEAKKEEARYQLRFWGFVLGKLLSVKEGQELFDKLFSPYERRNIFIKLLDIHLNEIPQFGEVIKQSFLERLEDGRIPSDGEWEVKFFQEFFQELQEMCDE